MIAATLLLCCILFIEAFLFLELGKQAREILASTRDTLRTLADSERTDDEKERCARRAARLMTTTTVIIILKLAAIGAVLAGVFLGAAALAPESKPGLIAALGSPAVAVALTLAGIAYVWMRNALLRQI